MEWNENANGNFWTKDIDGLNYCTVFETKKGGWKWVFDGIFSDQEYDSPEEAMEAAENDN